MRGMSDERNHAEDRALAHASRFGETDAEAADREAWERRLAPLLLAVEPVAPPASLLPRIEAELDRPGPEAALLPLRRALRLWRGAAALGFAAAAAALVLFVAEPAETAGARYVAVVTADDGRSGAGLVIQFDTATGVATVVPVASPPSGNSYQMWTIPQGETQPVSLGLLPEGPDARSDFRPVEGQLFAISLEPQGGSPNGRPTRPLYHGNLVRVD